MSLDVCLSGESRIEACDGRCSHCYEQVPHTRTVRSCYYSANMTHNLGEMAQAAGIYKALWRPEEIGITHAKQLIELLRAGLAKLEADPASYQKFNAPNGWGTYVHFVPFVRDYLAACETYPDAEVSVDR